MDLTPAQRSVIERVLNVFESGTPEGDYGLISIYHDGPHDIRQITYGRCQTTEYGNLRILVQMYITAQGAYSARLQKFADRVGSEPLVDNDEFKSALREAGREDPIMRRAQDQCFDERYFQPAMLWADGHKFLLPLSALVIYDSYIHSGSILWLIRQRFPENPPDLGGDEKDWIRAYVRERQKWLQNHHREAVRQSVYRTKCLLREINRDNWDLASLPIVANGVQVYP